MKIVTDCAADLSAEELKELGIEQAPLYIQFPEGEVSSMDISADAFYDRLEAMQPNIPTTAMASSGIFAEIYRKVAKLDTNIFSLHISSGLSGTMNAARAGIEEVKREADVALWDTLTLSGGERFQVITAALAAKANWTMQAIQERLAKIREKTEVIYTLDTLDYLARGGRIGRVKAMAGALLSSQAGDPSRYRWKIQHRHQCAHDWQRHVGDYGISLQYVRQRAVMGDGFARTLCG